MYNEDDAVAKVDGYIDLGHRRRPFVGREEARADRGGRPHGGRGDAASAQRIRGRAGGEAGERRPPSAGRRGGESATMP